jgi:hypothetical protein
MWDLLFWFYFANAVLLINHEIDSAYWREWNLFKLPGGIAVFLVVHLIAIPPILYGMMLLRDGRYSGLIFSLILCVAGVFAFTIHTYFISRGRQEFRAPVSLFILAAALVVSLAQGTITIYLMGIR